MANSDKTEKENEIKEGALDLKDQIKMSQILNKTEREKINNIKVDLSNINSNTNFAKFAQISSNIYIDNPE